MICFKRVLLSWVTGFPLLLVVTITCCVYKQKGFLFGWVQPCNVPWGSEDKDGNLSLCTHLRTM